MSLHENGTRILRSDHIDHYCYHTNVNTKDIGPIPLGLVVLFALEIATLVFTLVWACCLWRKYRKLVKEDAWIDDYEQIILENIQDDKRALKEGTRKERAQRKPKAQTNADERNEKRIKSDKNEQNEKKRKKGWKTAKVEEKYKKERF